MQPLSIIVCLQQITKNLFYRLKGEVVLEDDTLNRTVGGKKADKCKQMLTDLVGVHIGVCTVFMNRFKAFNAGREPGDLGVIKC